jgi:hypothetical protein
MIYIKIVAVYVKPLIIGVLLWFYDIRVLAETRLYRQACHRRSGCDLGAVDADEKYAVLSVRKPMQMLKDEYAAHYKAQLHIDGLSDVIRRDDCTSIIAVLLKGPELGLPLGLAS